MAKPLFARIAGMLSITLLAVCFVGLLPLLSAARTTGNISSVPGVTVNREFKGDLLPFHAALNSSILESDFAALKQLRVQSQTEAPHQIMPHEIPFACDPSFSPVATPRLAYVYGRCMS